MASDEVTKSSRNNGFWISLGVLVLFFAIIAIGFGVAYLLV